MPHRQFVFTIPRNLRGYFRRDRALLRELPRLAWETVHEVYGEYAGPAAVPGMITFLQTFDELVNWHPHIHALVTDGVFLPTPADEDVPAATAFLPLPKCPTGAFHLLWRERIYRTENAECRTFAYENRQKHAKLHPNRLANRK